jgi:hypothetical protein
LGKVASAASIPPFRVDDEGNELERGYAMKMLLPKWQGSEEVEARFKREVQIQQEELDHPNVMPIIARNLSANPPYFVMPLASHDLISAGQRLDRRPG